MVIPPYRTEALGFEYNGSNYFYLRNVQGDIIGIYDSTGTVVVNYVYDSWGKLVSITGSLASTIGVINPLRYRGYYYDTETGLYYLQSRYYDPETGRFINADGVIDNRGINTQNQFIYCGDNPVNNEDPDGHFFFGTIIGAGIGGIIGGVSGAISAAVKGKSVIAGAVTGAVTGAVIGGICGYAADAIATGGASLVIGAAVACGVVAAVGNGVNQYCNYKIEKKAQTKSSNQRGNSGNSTAKTPKSSNGKLASECNSFADYVDVKSIAVSGITAAVFVPIGIGANCVVNSAFEGLETGGEYVVAQIAADFAMGGNISMLQSIIDLL